jgi:hypothetical protein
MASYARHEGNLLDYSPLAALLPLNRRRMDTLKGQDGGGDGEQKSAVDLHCNTSL